jgi:vitamin B12 transporter
MFSCWVAAALVLADGGALAQSLGEVVVTANRGEREIEKTLADVSVADRAAIERAGMSTVPEFLQSMGGIEISEHGGAGAASGLFLRGTRTSQTVILVDGVRLENPTSGTGNLEFLPLAAVDRIEVVRGPMSSLYGSGAIGGVVQIFTRQGSGPPRPYVSIAGGSQRTGQLQAGVGGSAGATRYSLAATASTTEGFEATRPENPSYQSDRDGNAQRSLTASIAHKWSADWEAGANLLLSSGKSEYDDALSTPETAKMQYGSDALSGFVRGRLAPAWTSELRLGATRIDYTFEAFGFAPRTSTRTLVWTNAVALPVGRLLAGVEQLRQDISGDGVSTGPYPYLNDSRRTDSVFAGYEVSIDRQLLRLQLRSDRIGNLGSEPTGTLAWGYWMSPAWLFRASYASAFRAPTFDDLYSPFGSNPALLPEKSRGAELALEHHAADRLAKVTLFASRIDDAIELDATYTPRNLDSARVRGATFELRQQLDVLTLRASATLQDPEGERFDQATGEVVTGQLARRARQHAALAADWRDGPLQLGAQWLLQGRRVDSGGQWMGAYGVLHLTGSWQVRRGVLLFARLGNVGDKQYETAWGYPMPLRSLLVGLRWLAE